MTLRTKFLTSVGPMTPLERAHGRYMRAPDHPGGDGGQGGSDGGDAGGGDADGRDGGSELSTAEKLAQEFGDDQADDGAEAGDDDDGEGEEDLGSHQDDAGDGDDDGSDDGDGDGDEGDGSDGEDGGASDDNRSQPKVDEVLIAEANRRAEEAQREADKWKRIAEGAPAEPEAVAEGEKDPNAEPVPADFEFGKADPEYIAAHAEWRAVNRMREEGRQAQIRATINQLEADYQGRVPAALEKYPDYNEIVTQGAEGDSPKWACPPLVSVGIRSSTVGTDIAYHLAKNPEESRRIANLDPLEQAREFGKLEGRYLYEAELASKKGGDNPGAQQQQQQQRKQTPSKQSAAPKPPKRQTRGTGGRYKVPADTDDFAAFDKTYGN